MLRGLIALLGMAATAALNLNSTMGLIQAIGQKSSFRIRKLELTACV
jgi:hypothetical protein